MAPAIVRAEILMPVRKIIVPPPLFVVGEFGEINTIRILVTQSAYEAARNRMFRDMLENCRIASEVVIVHSAPDWRELRG